MSYLERFSTKVKQNAIKKFARENNIDPERLAGFMIENHILFENMTQINPRILKKMKIKKEKSDSDENLPKMRGGKKYYFGFSVKISPLPI